MDETSKTHGESTEMWKPQIAKRKTGTTTYEILFDELEKLKAKIMQQYNWENKLITETTAKRRMK